MILKIVCPRCEGPIWEEDLPDSDEVIDLACIICGYRTFAKKKKYLELKKRIARIYASNKRRNLPSQR